VQIGTYALRHTSGAYRAGGSFQADRSSPGALALPFASR